MAIHKIAIRKTIGLLLIMIGLAALFTPFTPGSWLIFVGLELLGFRMVFWDKIKAWFSTSAKGRMSPLAQKADPPPADKNMIPDRQNKIKRIIFIAIIILIIVAFLVPLAVGY